MASKTSVNASNLEALGAQRLAELLIEISTGNAVAKRRLRLELASTANPAEVAREVRKRLATIERSRSFVDWRNWRALVDDLELQRGAIVEHVAKADPEEALELMWRFMALAHSVLERCDDSGGRVIAVFHGAAADLGTIAVQARRDAGRLADRAFDALVQNDFGQYDGLIEALTPALGPAGLEHLKQRMIALSSEPVRRPPEAERRIIGYGSAGPMYEDEFVESSRASTVRMALMEIADALGDVDAFIGQYDEKTRTVPGIAAEIAERLLAAGRVQEAWQALEATEHRTSGWVWPDFEWENARIDVLEALNRADDAQAVRWSCFERSLSASHLRAYLKRLPDFDDVEAEGRALEYAETYRNLHEALYFLVSWPAFDRAAALVLQRAEKLDGNQYEVLSPAAEALAGRHPLAATLMLRAMIDFTLLKSRSSRYRHAAAHLGECARLASAIADFGGFEGHADYEARLRAGHGRKSSFWTLVD